MILWLGLLALSLMGCRSGSSVALGNTVASSTPTTTANTDIAYSSQELQPASTVLRTPLAERPPTMADLPTTRPTASPLPTRIPTATPVPSPTSLSLSHRQQVFEKIWRTVDENYLYSDFHGLDWEAVWTEFAPRVKAARSNEAFYALMAEMIGRLEDNHSRFLAPKDAVEANVFNVNRQEYVGIGVITMSVTDGALIQHVFAESPAEQAGLQMRDRIVAIDGAPIAGGGDIVGLEGTQVRLTIERPDEYTREVVLTRRHVEGRIMPVVHRLSGNIGYVGVTTLWVNDMADQFSGALTDLVVEKPLDGLILDLRGNPGGWRDVLTSVLGHFVRGNAGNFFDRQGDKPLLVHDSSGPDLRGLPLVVLIDHRTASYAEVLAAVLQAEAGAYVIGLPSSGNTESIYAYDMPGGSRLWVAQEGFRLRNGVNLEGQGVQPDLVLDVDWTRYSEASDPYILAALDYLDG